MRIDLPISTSGQQDLPERAMQWAPCFRFHVDRKIQISCKVILEYELEWLYLRFCSHIVNSKTHGCGQVKKRFDASR